MKLLITDNNPPSPQALPVFLAKGLGIEVEPLLKPNELPFERVEFPKVSCPRLWNGNPSAPLGSAQKTGFESKAL